MYTINVKDIPNKFSCIYKINYPNGKIYIGQTCNLKRRINEHNNFSKAAQPCDLAIKKIWENYRSRNMKEKRK